MYKDDSLSDGDETYFLNDNETLISNISTERELKYEAKEEEMLCNNVKECDQESMNRHKFDRESMKSYNTNNSVVLSSANDTDQYIVDVMVDDANDQMYMKTSDIDPSILYKMAKIFSQSDSEINL